MIYLKNFENLNLDDWDYCEDCGEYIIFQNGEKLYLGAISIIDTDYRVFVYEHIYYFGLDVIKNVNRDPEQFVKTIKQKFNINNIKIVYDVSKINFKDLVMDKFDIVWLKK